MSTVGTSVEAHFVPEAAFLSAFFEARWAFGHDSLHVREAVGQNLWAVLESVSAIVEPGFAWDVQKQTWTPALAKWFAKWQQLATSYCCPPAQFVYICILQKNEQSSLAVESDLITLLPCPTGSDRPGNDEGAGSQRWTLHHARHLHCRPAAHVPECTGVQRCRHPVLQAGRQAGGPVRAVPERALDLSVFFGCAVTESLRLNFALRFELLPPG